MREERQRARRAQQRADHEALGARLETLDTLEETLAVRRRELAAAPAIANFDALVEAEREVSIQKRLRAAAAAKLYVTGSGEITVDGEPLALDFGEETPVELHDGTTVHIGEVTARYAAAAGESGVDGVEKAQAELVRLLDNAGCETVEEARAAHEKHEQLATCLLYTSDAADE